MRPTPLAFAAFVAFDVASGKVLLHRREDFRIWALPGGGVEPGETLKAAAVREVDEETGYQVTAEHLVGIYTRPQFNSVAYLYSGRVIGGQPIQRGPETVEVGWFSPDNLPGSLLGISREMIADALNGSPQVIERVQYYPGWQMLLLRLLIPLRDLRNRIQGRP